MQRDLIVVIGLGQFGDRVARTLAGHGREVLAIDVREEKVEAVKDVVTRAVRADATDAPVLRAVGAGEAAAAVLGMGEEHFEAAVLTVAALKDLGVPKILVRAVSPTHGRIFERVGATRVIYPELSTGEQVAFSLEGRGVLESTALSSGHTLVEVEPRPEWIGRTLADLRLRASHGVSVVAVKRRVPFVDGAGAERVREELVDAPGPDVAIGAHDRLVIVGTRAAIERVARR
jgi:trk system potassium uptake protein TrkA